MWNSAAPSRPELPAQSVRAAAPAAGEGGSRGQAPLIVECVLVPSVGTRGVPSSSEAQEHVLEFLGFSPEDLHRVLHPVILDQYYT